MKDTYDLQEAKLENWREHYGSLLGIVSGHPQLKDGATIRTSTVRYLNREKRIAVTVNTVYTLGEEQDGTSERKTV